MVNSFIFWLNKQIVNEIHFCFTALCSHGRRCSFFVFTQIDYKFSDSFIQWIIWLTDSSILKSRCCLYWCEPIINAVIEMNEFVVILYVLSVSSLLCSLLSHSWQRRRFFFVLFFAIILSVTLYHTMKRHCCLCWLRVSNGRHISPWHDTYKK